MPIENQPCQPPPSIQEVCRVVTKYYKGSPVHFHISILPEDVRIHRITICGRDYFDVVDPEIRRAAYEEFKHLYINRAA